MTFSCKCLYVVCNVLAACMYAWPSFMNAYNHAGWICSTLISRHARMRGFVLRVVIEQKVRGLLGRSDCTWLTLFKWTPIHNIHDSNVGIYKWANSHTCRCMYMHIHQCISGSACSICVSCIICSTGKAQCFMSLLHE